MRLVKETSFERGLNFAGVEAKDEATLDRLIAKLKPHWEREWTTCTEDCTYGWTTAFAVRCDDYKDFAHDFKVAKAEIKAENMVVARNSPSN